MSFNLSGLSTYTDQLSSDLISAALLKSYSVNMLTLRAGLTAGTTAINVLNSTVDILDSTCGFGNAAVGTNSTNFTQIDLVVQSKMLKEVLCPEDLRTYWLSSQLSPSAYLESVPFEKLIADNKVNNIAQFIENTIWQGDGGTLDGLLDQITVANGATWSGNSGSTPAITVPLTVATAADTIWGIISKLSNALKQENDLVMYMSYSNYAIAVQALQATGNAIIAQYPNISNAAGLMGAATFVWPGTNVTIYAAGGINDNNHIILGPKKYAFFGTGLLDDQDKFKFYYDPSQDQVNFMAKFRLGTAAYASQFVSTL
jgi:hypothetical protein